MELKILTTHRDGEKRGEGGVGKDKQATPDLPGNTPHLCLYYTVKATRDK